MGRLGDVDLGDLSCVIKRVNEKNEPNLVFVKKVGWVEVREQAR